jgi:hypothetical protein
MALLHSGTAASATALHLRYPAGAVVEGDTRSADSRRASSGATREGCDDALHKSHDPAPNRVGPLGANALANPKISLVRLSSAFSLRSRFSISASLLVNRPSRPPRSASSSHTIHGTSQCRSPALGPHQRSCSPPRTDTNRSPNPEPRGELARSSHNQLLPWPNQTKIERLQKAVQTSKDKGAHGLGRVGRWQEPGVSPIRARFVAQLSSTKKSLSNPRVKVGNRDQTV